MTPRLVSGPRDRAVGGWLRVLREGAEQGTVAAAGEQGWSGSKLSRIESGRNRVSLEDAASLLGFYRVPGEQRERVLALARPVDEFTCWWEPGMPGHPPGVGLSFHELEATRIVQWSPNVIPEPLQTPGHARAVFSAKGVPEEDISQHLAAQSVRARIATHPTVPYVVYLGETALRTPFGGEMRSHQLRHLIDLSRQIELRVVRQSSIHAGLDSGWTALHYGPRQRVVRVELLGSAVYLNQEAALPYAVAERQLEEVALPQASSRGLIASSIGQLALLG